MLPKNLNGPYQPISDLWKWLRLFSQTKRKWLLSFLIFALNPYPCASPSWIDDIQIWLIWIDFSSFTEFLWVVYFNHTLQKSNPPPQYLSETPRTLHFRITLVTQALTYQEGILEETKVNKVNSIKLDPKMQEIASICLGDRDID